MGSGRVFPISEEAILCDPMPIPNHWYQIIGVGLRLGASIRSDAKCLG